jgi:hypothetical protein
MFLVFDGFLGYSSYLLPYSEIPLGLAYGDSLVLG